jgi:cellulose biosynthesis protein BcsQ
MAGVLADQGGHVAIIDTDPTQTVARWAKKEVTPKNITTYSADQEDVLLDAIEDADRSHHVILIDVEGRASTVGNIAMAKSSLVIVPVQPSEPDGHEAAKTIRAIRTAGRAHDKSIKFAVVMNRMPGAIVSRTYREVITAFDEAGIPVVAHLVDREAYRRMLMVGGTVFTLTDAQAPNLTKAKNEAYIFGEKIGRMVGLIGEGGGTDASEDLADRAPDAFKRAAEADRSNHPVRAEETIDDLADRELEELLQGDASR